jgi:hypothetical protein
MEPSKSAKKNFQKIPNFGQKLSKYSPTSSASKVESYYSSLLPYLSLSSSALASKSPPDATYSASSCTYALPHLPPLPPYIALHMFYLGKASLSPTECIEQFSDSEVAKFRLHGELSKAGRGLRNGEIVTEGKNIKVEGVAKVELMSNRKVKVSDLEGMDVIWMERDGGQVGVKVFIVNEF